MNTPSYSKSAFLLSVICVWPWDVKTGIVNGDLLSADGIGESQGAAGRCWKEIDAECCKKDNTRHNKLETKCNCKPGYAAGRTEGKPSCVKEYIINSKHWCAMKPCPRGEACQELRDSNNDIVGWQCDNGQEINIHQVSQAAG